MEFMHLELGQHDVKDDLEGLKEVNRKFALEYESQKDKVSSYTIYKKYLNKCFYIELLLNGNYKNFYSSVC